MEYNVITPNDSEYPQKLIERLGQRCPDNLYYHGPLELLDHFSFGVICSDDTGGIVLMETNQVLFTVREYEMNYIGSWHSIIETEIFRLSLFRKNKTTTLFSAKGLQAETFDSYLLDRFYPPLGHFPERDEYFRRAETGEMLMLSVCNPEETRQLRKNIMERNWTVCMLADIVFIPYGEKGSKTYTMAKRISKENIPIFTIDHEESKDLHDLGIPGFNRKTVKAFLEANGAKLPNPKNEMIYLTEIPDIPTSQQPAIKNRSTQMEFNFDKP